MAGQTPPSIRLMEARFSRRMSTLSISGGGAHGAFATLTGQLTINTATVTAVGGGSHGLASFGAGSFLFARNVTINTSGLGALVLGRITRARSSWMPGTLPLLEPTGPACGWG